jgi:hypothetical protein
MDAGGEVAGFGNGRPARLRGGRDLGPDAVRDGRPDVAASPGLHLAGA